MVGVSALMFFLLVFCFNVFTYIALTCLCLSSSLFSVGKRKDHPSGILAEHPIHKRGYRCHLNSLPENPGRWYGSLSHLAFVSQGFC